MRMVKKRLLRGFSVLVFCLVLMGTCYFGWRKYQVIHAENKIHDTLADIGIPLSQLVIYDRVVHEDNTSGGEKMYTEEITTKKDYRNWKKQVEQSGKYLSGEALGKSEDALSLKKCELRYSIVYTPSNREISIAQIYAGDSLKEGDEKEKAFAFQIKQ